MSCNNCGRRVGWSKLQMFQICRALKEGKKVFIAHPSDSPNGLKPSMIILDSINDISDAKEQK